MVARKKKERDVATVFEKKEKKKISREGHQANTMHFTSTFFHSLAISLTITRQSSSAPPLANQGVPGQCAPPRR
jgi:hypothetical protein